MVGASKGKEAIHMEAERQMFGKIVFAGPSLTKGQREDFDQRGLVRLLPVIPN